MIAERFLADVKGHELTVIKDEGVYRHLRFRNPKSSNMFFDLVTWPGFLAYSGDMGCYVFARLTDMFEFFRAPPGSVVRRIDFNYWAQKLAAADKSDGVKKFREEKFTRKVMEYLVGWIRENREETTKEQRRELWDEVVSQVIEASGDEGGYRKQCAAHDFRHDIYSAEPDISKRSPRFRFEFTDFWEYDVEEYSFRFLWCCHAIQWGIGVYDALPVAQTEATPCAQ